MDLIDIVNIALTTLAVYAIYESAPSNDNFVIPKRYCGNCGWKTQHCVNLPGCPGELVED